MGRPAKPRLDKRRGRWYANIGPYDRQNRRREVYAPATIGPRDEAGAWRWLASEQAAREPPPVAIVESRSTPRKRRKPRPKTSRWIFDTPDRLDALAARALETAMTLQSRVRGGMYKRVAILDQRATKLRARAVALRASARS